MNPERWKIYRECKPYIVFNNEKCIDELSNNAPNEIKKKWKQFNEMQDDLIIISDNEELKTLLDEYHKLFPKDHFFPEWFDIPNREKIIMLKEAIQEKKDLSQTKLFDKYQEKVVLGTRKCKCCEKYTIDKDSIYDICSNCGWESDSVQEENPDYYGGANKLSLNVCRAIIKANKLLSDKSLCLFQYADTKDYVLFSYGTKDGKPEFDDCLIKVDKKTQKATYYEITNNLKEINKLDFKDIDL